VRSNVVPTGERAMRGQQVTVPCPTQVVPVR
jgi:hypothetical protein